MSMYGDGPRVQVQVIPGRSRTKQSMKEECDVNRIVERFTQGHMVTHLAKGVPRFMDVSEVGDYRSALEHLRTTNEFFEKLPARVREAFQNDPAAFLDALDTAEGQEALRKAGVDLTAKEEPAPEGAGSGTV